MIKSEAGSARLHPVTSDSLLTALAATLAGGGPIAPLPDADVERTAVLEMLSLSAPVTEPDAAVVVGTSGSTGRPKGVVLSRAAIAASVTATHRRLGGPGDWVLALPGHYVAGLMVIARSVLAGTGVQRVPGDLDGLSDVSERMSGRRYISLVPTQLVRACADAQLSAALAGFDAVLLGGAAADLQLLAAARDRQIPVVTTYGMSETCGGCVYDGVPLDGIQVSLEPASGRIRIGGPTLFSGYRLRPDLTDAVRSGPHVITADRGHWQGRRLVVDGRLDDVVVSGGVNVDLSAVERAAAGWPGLHGAEIAVLGIPDAEWGTAVVGVTNGSGSADDLRAYLTQSLPAAAAPRRLVHVPTLPRTSGGKIDRQRLIAELTISTRGDPR